jgi:hypothetical protein
VPFDPRRMKGAHGHMKTVKGGFKPEKVVEKKFKLDAIVNPYSIDGEDDSDE